MNALVKTLLVLFLPLLASSGFGAVQLDSSAAINQLKREQFGNVISRSKTVEFHIESTAGWEIKGVTSWILFVAILRGTLQPNQTINVIKLVPTSSP